MWWFFVRDFYKLGAALPEAVSLVPPPSTIQPASIAQIIREEVDGADETPAPTSMPSLPSNLMLHAHRAATEGAQAFGVWDAENGFTMFSANWSRVTGLRAEFCEGFALILQLTPGDQYGFHQALEAGQKERQELTINLRCPDESIRSLECECLPPTDNQPYMTVLMRDVTDRAALENNLVHKEQELAHANQSRSAFLSCMSHELRTPLNAIIGFSSMMREEILGKLEHEGYAEYANHIHESGQNLLDRISDLLEIAAIDAGGLSIDEEEFALDDMAAELNEMHSHKLFEREITLNINTHGMRLKADRRKLLYAVSHLLGNAISHSKAGSTIQLYSSISADGALALSLRDYGEGMPAEKLTHIRHALASKVSYAHIREDGIGLGLALSNEIMSQHQGSLSIDGSKLEGTIVNLQFPAARVPHSMQQPRLVKS